MTGMDLRVDLRSGSFYSLFPATDFLPSAFLSVFFMFSSGDFLESLGFCFDFTSTLETTFGSGLDETSFDVFISSFFVSTFFKSGFYSDFLDSGFASNFLTSGFLISSFTFSLEDFSTDLDFFSFDFDFSSLDFSTLDFFNSFGFSIKDSMGFSYFNSLSFSCFNSLDFSYFNSLGFSYFNSIGFSYFNSLFFSNFSLDDLALISFGLGSDLDSFGLGNSIFSTLTSLDFSGLGSLDLDFSFLGFSGFTVLLTSGSMGLTSSYFISASGSSYFFKWMLYCF